MALNLPTQDANKKDQPNRFFPRGETHITAVGPSGPLSLPETAKVVNGLLAGHENGAKDNVVGKSIWKWYTTVGQEHGGKAVATSTEAKQHEAWLVKSPIGQQTIHKVLLASPLTNEHQIASLAGYLGIAPAVLQEYLDTCYPRRTAMILAHNNAIGQ